jgi:Uncharacterized protein conserved in bacteria (DUF2252)
MRMYGELCGWALARAHTCSGDRIAIAAYLGRTGVNSGEVGSFVTNPSALSAPRRCHVVLPRSPRMSPTLHPLGVMRETRGPGTVEMQATANAMCDEGDGLGPLSEYQ